MVYPPPAESADNCMACLSLRFYKGDTFVYVGEGRKGATASAAFFDVLESEWECKQIVELDPFPQCFEKLFVFRRKVATR